MAPVCLRNLGQRSRLCPVDRASLSLGRLTDALLPDLRREVHGSNEYQTEAKLDYFVSNCGGSSADETAIESSKRLAQG